jgi:hypothetical protein
MHKIRTITATRQMARTAQILLTVLPRHRPEIAKTKAGGHQTYHQNTKPTLSGISGKCDQTQRLNEVGQKRAIIATIQISAAKPSHLPLGDLFMAVAAQNEREAEDEFAFHGLSQSGPFFAFVRAMSNFNGNR